MLRENPCLQLSLPRMRMREQGGYVISWCPFKYVYMYLYMHVTPSQKFEWNFSGRVIF